MTATVRLHTDQHLRPDPSRVIGRLFLPSTEPPHVGRARDLLDRLRRLDEQTVAEMLPAVLQGFGPHHADLRALLLANAAVLLEPHEELSEARTLLVGAAFTLEYAVEGAALCNPAVVPHPDQRGLAEGQLRVAVALRGIGEGHLSALQFSAAIVDDEGWRFEERLAPPVVGSMTLTAVPRSLFDALVRAGREPDELTLAVLQTVPAEVHRTDVEKVLVDLPPDLLLHPEAHLRVETLRRWAAAGYTVTFDESTTLDQRVLMPTSEDERQGLEDARFTLFTDDDGSVEYRACYTAYDGMNVSNRLLTSPDLLTFTSFPLTGRGARNKGMALFPRKVGGRHLALSRADGITIGLTSSDDGYRWGDPVAIESPTDPWQILQVGNGSPPIETESGWLVIIHGVGVMRMYSLGAILLDLDDPTRVIGRLDEPLLPPVAHGGYVPNVVFSCGAISHRGRLFIPYGIGDASVSVASVSLDELLSDLGA
ncbi:MAG: glycosylase [Actinobacteria bacterium]|nr:glycosylase [Actinomycetota bacterium]